MCLLYDSYENLQPQKNWYTMYKKTDIQCTKNLIYNVQKTRYTMYKKTDTQCTKKPIYNVQKNWYTMYKKTDIQCTRKLIYNVQENWYTMYKYHQKYHNYNTVTSFIDCSNISRLKEKK